MPPAILAVAAAHTRQSRMLGWNGLHPASQRDDSKIDSRWNPPGQPVNTRAHAGLSPAAYCRNPIVARIGRWSEPAPVPVLLAVQASPAAVK